MTTLRFIGDVHGKYEKYFQIISDCEQSIQVGDMGLGFKFDSRPDPVIPPGHRFIRGNHDNPAACAKHPNWIPDGHVEGNMMFIGGADSIDKQYRTEDIDWWADEELSYQRLLELTDKYIRVKPEIMVTHDVPEIMIYAMFPGALPLRSRTQVALNTMLCEHQPKLWSFGHWHTDRDYVHPMLASKTRFICLDELSYIDVNIETLETSKILKKGNC